MGMSLEHLARWNRIEVGLGVSLWLLIVLARAFGWLELSGLDLILLFALGVIAPLALPLALSGMWQGKLSPLLLELQRLALLICPGAALFGGASLLLKTGPLACAAACAWLLYTMLLAVSGLSRLRTIRSIALPDACLALALIYLPIGGAWLAASRLGLRPLGFSPTTVELTAVHFHYITLAALVLAGLIGKVMQDLAPGCPRQLYRLAAVSMLASPLLVATGITLTQVTGSHIVESCAALLLALSLIGISLLSLRYLVTTTTPLVARGLLVVSSVAVFFTMLLAIAYAVGAATGAWTITIPQMIAVHGWTNALAFGFCGLLGWRLRIARP
jgi:YndJ-like protein